MSKAAEYVKVQSAEGVGRQVQGSTSKARPCFASYMLKCLELYFLFVRFKGKVEDEGIFKETGSRRARFLMNPSFVRLQLELHTVRCPTGGELGGCGLASQLFNLRSIDSGVLYAGCCCINACVSLLHMEAEMRFLSHLLPITDGHYK